jgi:geranylgeranylglycerol-phosphate geranylgeranyltransferase
MCTFISNDLSDIERDRINHPDRPLPSGYLAPSFVTVIYFTCLTLALFTTHRFVQTPISFLYYLLLSFCISYNYIVAHLPLFKATYVAGASSVPILILAAYYPTEKALYPIALALFAFMLGRELCKDILDRAGDPESILQRIPANHVAMFAFSSQAFALAILTVGIDDVYHLLDLICMTALFGLSYRLWFRQEQRVEAVGLMKLSLFLGLYFLL